RGPWRDAPRRRTSRDARRGRGRDARRRLGAAGRDQQRALHDSRGARRPAGARGAARPAAGDARRAPPGAQVRGPAGTLAGPAPPPGLRVRACSRHTGRVATPRRRHGFETRAIHAGQEPEATTGAVVVPIFQTSTFVQEAVGKHKGYEYGRTGNPTRTALELCLASLEGARWALAFASGMAATDATAHLLEKG